MAARLFLFAIFCLCSVRSAQGDLRQYIIRTTEWLVDHSTVICVAEFANTRGDSIPKVLNTIKGDPGKVNWRRLGGADFDGQHYFGPPARGSVRLLFIGQNSELWQAVDLGRSPIQSPTLYDVFYGVDQFGRVHLTESSLMAGIRAHMAAQPSKPVRHREKSFFFRRSGITAPAYFPFENCGETFVLVVNFNETRRDYYVAQLENGDCAERLHAITELSQLDDAKALAAIEAATHVSGVQPSHVFKWSDRRVHPQADDVVRTAARNALKELQ